MEIVLLSGSKKSFENSLEMFERRNQHFDAVLGFGKRVNFSNNFICGNSTDFLHRKSNTRHSEDKYPFECEESLTNIATCTKDSSHSVKSNLNFSNSPAQNDVLSFTPARNGVKSAVTLPAHSIYPGGVYD